MPMQGRGRGRGREEGSVGGCQRGHVLNLPEHFAEHPVGQQNKYDRQSADAGRDELYDIKLLACLAVPHEEKGPDGGVIDEA